MRRSLIRRPPPRELLVELVRLKAAHKKALAARAEALKALRDAKKAIEGL